MLATERRAGSKCDLTGRRVRLKMWIWGQPEPQTLPKTKNSCPKTKWKVQRPKVLAEVNTLFLMPKGQACKLRGPPCPTHTKCACKSGGWGRKAACPRLNWRVAWKFETRHSQERKDAATMDISAACADATLCPQQQWAPGLPPERWAVAPMAS